MSSKDPAEETDYAPRPHDFLVEPLFAPFEKCKQGELADGAEGAKSRGLLGRLFGWLLPRKTTS